MPWLLSKAQECAVPHSKYRPESLLFADFRAVNSNNKFLKILVATLRDIYYNYFIKNTHNIQNGQWFLTVQECTLSILHKSSETRRRLP